MKALQQLQEMSRLALADKHLVEIAQGFTPTAAYEQAISHHYNEELARSCRFLAIIQRDYGADVIEVMLDSAAQSDCDNLLTEMVIPGIKALEKILDDDLKIVEPECSKITLVDYLRESKTCSLDVGLEIGEYEITLAYNVVSSNNQLVISCKFIVFSPSGEPLKKEKWVLWTTDDLKNPNDVRKKLYSFLHESLFSFHAWPHDSALILIRNDLEKHGEKISARLSKAIGDLGGNECSLKRYGLVHKIQELGAKIRSQAVADGVSKLGLAILEYEIEASQKQAENRNKQLDLSIPLIDKLRHGMFGVRYSIVPGPEAEKTYNLLLHAEHVSTRWLEILQSKGYGGSTLISFYNIDSGMYVAETGQCDAFILQQHGGRKKDDILTQAQDAMRSSQIARGNAIVRDLPKFKYDPGFSNDETCGGFDKFLDDNLPRW